jgi:hypothetical protein
MLRLPLVLGSTILGITLATGLAYALPERATAIGGDTQKSESMPTKTISIMIGLMRLPQVQQELNLSDEQNSTFQASRGVPGLVLRPVTEKDGQWLTQVLKPEQLKRLRQLYLQSQGAAALIDSEAAKTLRISDAQRKKLISLYTEAAEGRSRAREEKVARKIDQQFMEDARKVLTKKQQATLDEMIGKRVGWELPAPAMPLLERR